jgi:hypothetical protein
VNEILYSQIENEVKSEYLKKSSLDRKQIEDKIRKQVSDEANVEIDSYKEQLQAKSIQVIELNKTKAQLVKLEREKEELKGKIEAEAEIKITQKLNEERQRIQSELADKSDLKIAEKDQLIQQLKKQLTDSQKKIEQVSMQVQGSVQEVLIGQFLKDTFQLDRIESVGKGISGADVLQIVNTREKLDIGRIYYESKRTSNFSLSWLPKFRQDMISKNSTLGVIVTTTMPRGMEDMAIVQLDGIWVCTFSAFKSLCFVLRSSIELINDASVAQENKGSKMSLLYDFLTSPEFKLQVESLTEGLTIMQTDLEKEKRAMTAIFKRREKQIQGVILNTINIYSSIKGIAGNSIGDIPTLTLSEK